MILNIVIPAIAFLFGAVLTKAGEAKSTTELIEKHFATLTEIYEKAFTSGYLFGVHEGEPIKTIDNPLEDLMGSYKAKAEE